MINTSTTNNAINTSTTNNVINQDNISSDDFSLPTFQPMPLPDFCWGNLDGTSFCNAVNCAYDEVIHWKKRFSSVTSGALGKKFINEMTKLISAYSEGSSIESIALKALMIMPSLLLQKPFFKSKMRHHSQCLKCRLALWEKGNIDELIHEG